MGNFRAAISLGALLSLGLACSPSAPNGGAASTSDGASAASLPMFWLVDTPLSAQPGEEPVLTVRGPALVEVEPDGKVRSFPGGGATFEGYLPVAALQDPADRRGLMLYAQRVAEMHLDSPIGPVLGKVHPGAFVSALAEGEDAYRIVVPRYGEKESPLFAYVEKSALGVAPKEQVAPTLAGKRVRDFGFDLKSLDESRVYTRLLCGDFHVEQEGGVLWATQYNEGIEVRAVVDRGEWVWGERGDYRCQVRMVYQQGDRLREARGKDFQDSVPIETVPEDYRRVDLPMADPFAAVMEHRASVFWLVPTRRGLACHEWKVVSWNRPSTWDSGHDLQGKLARQHDSIHASFDISYRRSQHGPPRGEALFFGPHFDGGGYRCARPFHVLGADSDTLYVENPGMHSGEVGWQLVAFHPDEVEHWFRSAGACETARIRAAQVIAQDPTAVDHLGLHQDCFEELHP